MRSTTLNSLQFGMEQHASAIMNKPVAEFCFFYKVPIELS
jgi:hypothetical protein